MTERLIGIAEAISNRRAECEEAVARLGEVVSSASVVSDFRKRFGEDLTNVLLSMASLQSKAEKKFSPDDSERIWWVTDKSLQQATAWQVSKLKAGWFGGRAVFDLCCGVGGDAMQFAERGPVTAIDADPLLAAMAQANLAGGRKRWESRAQTDDATKIELPVDAAVHMDPDRRSQGPRSSQPDFYQPKWQQICRIVESVEAAVVKVAPAAQFDTQQSELAKLTNAHRCWISLRGTVREQALLFGDALEKAGLPIGQSSAAALVGDGSVAWFVPKGSADSPSVCSEPKSIMVDPDASIRAAGLTEAFASEHDCQLLGSAAGFLTCENENSFDALSKLAIVGSVIWSGAFDDRKLRRELRDRNLYPQRIKVRGTGNDPAALAKRYRRCGETPVTLWLGRSGKRVFAVLTNDLETNP